MQMKLFQTVTSCLAFAEQPSGLTVWWVLLSAGVNRCSCTGQGVASGWLRPHDTSTPPVLLSPLVMCQLWSQDSAIPEAWMASLEVHS
eukprot:4182011-Amphidinium_carterae.1